MSEKFEFYPSDTNLTSISQRIPNKHVPSKPAIMPDFPKIDLCQTNWQQEDANILSSKIASASVPNNDSDKENDSYKLMPPPTVNEIEFFSWTPYLNRNLQIAVKGQTKDGFERGRSIQKRLSNTELLDKGYNKQKLRGTISINKDLPMYIVEKFKNGFPEDWETVTATWADYVRLQKPNDFHWPQSISDLNDEINDNQSEYSNKTCDSIISHENSTLVQDEPSKRFINNTYKLVESSEEQVKILSNVLIKKSNLEKQSQNTENIVSQLQNQQNDCLLETVNEFNENSHSNDSVTNNRKRNHSTENSSMSEDNKNKRIKLAKVVKSIEGLIQNLIQLKDQIIDIDSERAKEQTAIKSTQTETFEINTTEIPEIKTPSLPISPDIMGIPSKKSSLVSSTRSAYLRNRKIRRKSKNILHQSTQSRNFGLSNEKVVENTSSSENQSFETSKTLIDIDFTPKRTLERSPKMKKYTKISTNKMEEYSKKNYRKEAIDSQKDNENDTRNSFVWEGPYNVNQSNLNKFETPFENNSPITEYDIEKIPQKRAASRSLPLTERRKITKISRIFKPQSSDSGLSKTIIPDNVTIENKTLVRSSAENDPRKIYNEKIDFQKENEGVSSLFVSKGTHSVHQNKFQTNLKPGNEIPQKRVIGRSSSLNERRHFTKISRISKQSDSGTLVSKTITPDNVAVENNTLIRSSVENDYPLVSDSRKNYEPIGFQKENERILNSFVTKDTFNVHQSTPKKVQRKNETVIEISSSSETQMVEPCNNNTKSKFDIKKIHQERASEGVLTTEKNISTNKMYDEDCERNNQWETINSEKYNEDDTRNSFICKNLQTSFENNSSVETQNFETNINNTEIDIEKIFQKRAANKSSPLIERRKLTKISRISKPKQSNLELSKTVDNSFSCATEDDDHDGQLFSESYIGKVNAVRKSKCENLERSPKVVLENINPIPHIQYSLRGRVRSGPLKYWEGETLEKLVKNTNNKDAIIHPALRPENTPYLCHSKNGRVKLYDSTVEEQIDIVLGEENFSNLSQFTEF
ncbi:MATH and LRR domain-containing protein PFE0570w-like isoform X2 [Chrysoperla carnea]|uniref:MATH and LRR domain-containing protein PFE0570w-like isoform X2 n=1 Tax=Chrysoperla carnea TaxID=189513 RepID=UPI001D06A804|nr:MATH and LRR domain-containing protein PFE0570w-like isoform X2 [Chrysoperla carnea]